MVDYANRKSPQPEILSLAIKCENWNALPKAGGVLDQPDWLLTRMSIALNVFRAYKSFKKCQPGKEGVWIRDNPVYWEIITEYGLTHG